MSSENESSFTGKSTEIGPKLTSVKGSLGARAAAISKNTSEPKSDLETEDSESGLKLKKPSLPVPAKKLRPPASMPLKKPGESNSSETLQLKKPGGAGTKLSLKKPTPTSPEELSVSSSVAGLTKPQDATSTANPIIVSPPPTKSKTESEPENKLTQPGNLQLKKNAIPEVKKADDGSSGLRLRIPSETPPTDDQASEETVEADQENVKSKADEDSKGSEISLKLKKNDKKEKLGLVKPEDTHESNLTPPGVESSQESKSKKDPGENSAFTQPVEKVKFARKKKSKLTSKQKKQITFMGAPVLILFLVLGFMFISKFFFSVPQKSQSQKVEKVRKPTPKKKAKEPGKTKKGVKLRFPEELLTQLEDEYGVEGKKQFLEEWSRLSNRERKKYLIEIDAWKEDDEEKNNSL